ncbi:ABC transporter permease [Methylonatrum kenyense]|uniref:ABC transporter permease n=1 Tax=Methylonatrum kenyense TaxID=455253 RepID=UPI0020BF58CA|nr:ABC transporter permease [Methylonatrum kenyense]MCK8516004.1 ABC transporter permease [Methylonatrum kenyense]
MRTLRRKLLRDLLTLRGQILAIAVVIGAGVMTLILGVTTLSALSLTQERFYQERGFAEVFADLTRAPESLLPRLAEIPGIDRIESRVRSGVRLRVDDFDDPVRGLVLSIPDGRQPDINRLHLRMGQLPQPERQDEVVVSEPFAEAHGLLPGDQLTAIIHGREQRLRISGIALSPEFVYQTGPGDLLPDYRRYATLWMNRSALARATDLDGAFNSLVATLQAGARTEDVRQALDRQLQRYGGQGSYDRDEQASHRFISEELNQLRVMAVAFPMIFLGVAAFLLSVLLERIIRQQIQEIAVLKAFGYGIGQIARHYLALTALIVGLGLLLGLGFGAWAAEAYARLYIEYFRFPELYFRLQPDVVLLAVAVAILAGGIGTGRAVARAARLTPAQAMRPPLPARYRRGRLADTAFWRRLDQPARMILRNLGRHPLKSALSMLGIALSTSLILVGSYQFQAVDRLLDIQYRLVEQADLHLTLTEATPERAIGELRHLPGVLQAEGYRQVPVRLSHGHRSERTLLLGMEREPQLRRLIDADHRRRSLPEDGLVLTDFLAERLGLRTGDPVQVEVLDGERRILDLPLAAVVAEPIGVGAYLERRALNRLLGEGPAINGAWLAIDPASRDELFQRLDQLAVVAGIGVIGESETAIRAYIDETMLVLMGILLVLAGSIAFAVVYNNARIAFAERQRELATLRVLGFGRGEVAWVLIGELLLLTLIAIPLGWLIGTGFAWLLTEALSMDLLRLPFVVTAQAYGLSGAGILLATALSVLLIQRRLRRLDMVTALKAAE